jgi:glycosyltransferase involved in cell wall biosynthesis
MITQISLQKKGAATIDSFELFLSIKRQKIESSVLLSSGNEFKYRWDLLESKKDIYCIDTYNNSISGFLSSFFLLKWLRMLKVLRNRKSNVIVATHFHPWLLLITIFKKLYCKKFIYIVHENPYNPKEREGCFNILLQKILLRRSDIIITHSKSLKEELGRIIINKKVYSFDLGSYVNYCSISKKEKDFSAPKFLFLGRIEEYKGVDILVETFNVLRKKYPNSSLTIAGRGNLPVADYSYVKIINNWLSDKDVCDLFNENNVLILPYRKASQSGVLSVSWPCGVPVIASNIGGLPEQVVDGDNGFLFEPGSAQDLLKKMTIFCDDHTLLKKMSNRAKYYGEEVYTWDKVAIGIIDIIMGIK